jgi:hypothetical protein
MNENAFFSPSTLVSVIPLPVFFARNETAGNGGGCAPVAAVVWLLPNIMVTAV